jgi:hypothetical protein
MKSDGEQEEWFVKCPKCGSENDAYAIFCSACRQPLKESKEMLAPEPRKGILAAGLFIAVLLSVMLIFVWFSMPPEEEENSGSLVITLINPTTVHSLPCEYVLEINGQQEYDGTIPAGDSDVVQKNFTFSDSSLLVVIHVEVIGSSTQPDDMTVTISQGETERVTIVLQMTPE